MSRVNDPDGHRETWQREIEKLDDHEPTEDAAKLRKWTKLELDHKEPTTATWQLCKARLLSEGARMPLIEFDDAEAVTGLIGKVAGDFAEGTQRQYRQSARLFFKFLGRAWAKQIKVGSPSSENTPVGRDEVFTRHEVDALLAAAEHQRDRAFLLVLLATGQRRGALLTLTVGDVSFEGPNGENGTIYLSEEAVGLKDASGPRPLLFATEAVQKWLRDHPRRDEDDAPLFCTLKSGHGGNKSDGTYYEYEKGESLSSGQMRRRFRAIARRTAELDGHPTVSPERAGRFHYYRHSAATRMDKDPKMSESDIKWIMGWDPDSGQLDRYSHVTDGEKMANIRRAHGKDPEAKDVVIGRPTVDECPECGADVHIGTGACEECGKVLTAGAAMADEGGKTVFECASCGESISHTDAFCRYCGASQDDAATPNPDSMTDRDLALEVVGTAVEEHAADQDVTTEDAKQDVAAALRDMAQQTRAASHAGEVAEPVDMDSS